MDSKYIVNLNSCLFRMLHLNPARQIDCVCNKWFYIGLFRFSKIATKMDLHGRLRSDGAQREDQDLSPSFGINTSQIFNTDLFGCLFHASVVRRQSVYNAQGWCPAGRIKDFNKSAAFSMQIPGFIGKA